MAARRAAASMRPAAFEIGEKKPRRRERRPVRCGRRERARERRSRQGRGRGQVVHERRSRRAGTGRADRRSLGPHRLKPVPAGLSLSGARHEKCPALVTEGRASEWIGAASGTAGAAPRLDFYSAAAAWGCGSSASSAAVSSSSLARNSGSASASPSVLAASAA